MAFFGITHLGPQNPIGDKLIVKPRRDSPSLEEGTQITFHQSQEQPGPLSCTDPGTAQAQPLSSSIEIHKGSHKQYREMVKRIRTPRSPNQLYVTPLTDSQQYGWTASERPEPWTQIKRFPRKNSEMTRFVEEMSLTDREFSLF